MTPLSVETTSKPRRRRNLRSFLFGWFGKVLAGLVVLVAGGYYFENRRGAKALEAEMELMRDQNLAVDWRDLLRGPVPDAENFGATPVLKGLAADTKDQPVLVPGMESMDWSAVRFPQPEKPEDWREIREKLAVTHYFTPVAAAGETSDARAVYQALDRMEPVLAELAGVAGRRAAMFTPSPKERQAAGSDSLFIWPAASRPLTGVTRLLEIRATAAIELGEAAEALRMIRILRRMYEASQLLESAYTSPPFLAGITGEGLRRHVWTVEQSGELAGLLTLTDPAAAVAGTYHRFLLQDYALTQTDWGAEFRFPSKNWWRGRAAPGGWHDQGRAELLRVARERFILPVRSHGIVALVNHQAGVRREDLSPISIWPGCWMIQFEDEILPPLLYGEMMRRLTILALAAEQHRLKTGQPPQDGAQFLTALPADQRTDLDGKPLRFEMSKDGKTFSFYSVGENLRDDGNAAAKRAASSAWDHDWSLQVPVP